MSTQTEIRRSIRYHVRPVQQSEVCHACLCELENRANVIATAKSEVVLCDACDCNLVGQVVEQLQE